MIVQVAIKALDLIGKAMHPTHLGAPYLLRQRDELLGILLEYVAPMPNPKSSSPRKDENSVPHAVRIAGLNAIATFTYALCPKFGHSCYLSPSCPTNAYCSMAMVQFLGAKHSGQATE
jgi:hypothetical protein